MSKRSLDSLCYRISITTHASKRIKERTGVKNLDVIRMDIIKSIDRLRVKKHRHTGAYLVQGGFAYYIMTPDLRILTALGTAYKTCKLDSMHNYVVLSNEDKKILLNNIGRATHRDLQARDGGRNQGR